MITTDEASMLTMDGFDDCIAGVVERFGQPDIICYDKKKVIAKLVERDGMTAEDAVEFYEFNQLGSWVGESTPCFIIIPHCYCVDCLADIGIIDDDHDCLCDGCRPKPTPKP